MREVEVVPSGAIGVDVFRLFKQTTTLFPPCLDIVESGLSQKECAHQIWIVELGDDSASNLDQRGSALPRFRALQGEHVGIFQSIDEADGVAGLHGQA